MPTARKTEPSAEDPKVPDVPESGATTTAPAGAQTAPVQLATENPLGTPACDDWAGLVARVERLENLTGHRFITATADEERADEEILATLPKTYQEAVRWQAAKDRRDQREAERAEADGDDEGGK